MASQCKNSKKVTVMIVLLILLPIFSLLTFASPTYASCRSNTSECYSTCPGSKSQDPQDCLTKGYYYSSVPWEDPYAGPCTNTNPDRYVKIKQLKSECETAGGDTYGGFICSADPRGETPNLYYDLSVACYMQIAESGNWTESKITVCGCTYEDGESDSDVADVAGDLGLRDISLTGVFAGQLSINQLVQFVILTVMSILMLVLLFIIVKNGIAYAGSAEDEQKKKGAIKGITSALIGIGIVFGSYFILSLFFSFFGLSPFKKIVPIEDCEGLSGEALERCDQLINED